MMTALTSNVDGVNSKLLCWGAADSQWHEGAGEGDRGPAADGDGLGITMEISLKRYERQR